LEDIRHLVRNGATVQILDSQTGADITSKILMQIILEFDSPKLDLLTAPFLTEMIRVNDQVLLGFFEKFFHQALTSFIGFQNHLQRQMRTGSLLPSLFPTVNPWPNAPEETAPGQKLAAETNGHASEQDVRGTLHQLKAQIAALEKSVQRPLTRKKNALNR
jgi:polyhydroxyalkanoate synthesis repressor PhaR